MHLLKIGVFEIDYSLIILFLIGLVIGIVFFGIIFLIVMMSTRRNSSYVVKSKTDITLEELQQKVDNAVLEFKEKCKEKDAKEFPICMEISKRLISEISTIFFPKSKYPLFELTIDELLDLGIELSSNVEERLDKKVITKVAKKQIKVSFLLGLSDKPTEKNISELEKENSKGKIFSQFAGFIKKKISDVTNAVINKALNVFDIIPMVCILIIHICGEETYKAFYKKIYKNDNIVVDTGIDQIEMEIDKNTNNENT